MRYMTSDNVPLQLAEKSSAPASETLARFSQVELLLRSGGQGLSLALRAALGPRPWVANANSIHVGHYRSICGKLVTKEFTQKLGVWVPEPIFAFLRPGFPVSLT